MAQNFDRRLKKLELAAPRRGSYLLAWNDQGQKILLPSATPAAPGVPAFRRIIHYDRYHSQRAFDEKESTFKGFSGPVGTGKSKALCFEALKCCYLNPGVHGLLGAPTEALLESATLVELLRTLDVQAIPHEYRKSAKEVYLNEPNATILLRTLDNPDRLRGLNLGWFGIDELTYCKEAAWQQLEARLRDPKAPYRRGFAVWTPKGKDWVWQRFVSGRRVAGHELVQALPRENTAVLHAAPDYYDNMKLSYDEKFYRQEALGEYLDMHSGTVYHAFSGENVRSGTFDPALPLIVALDFNVNPMSGLLLQCETSYGRKIVRVLKEIILPDSNTTEWCERLIVVTRDWAQAVYQSGKPMETQFYGDSTGGSRSASSTGSSWEIIKQRMNSQQEYRARFLYAKNPAVLDRINAVNGMLCSFDEQDRKGRRLYIDPSCRELITDLEEVKWKVDASGSSYHEIDKRDPKRTHVSDALGYYVAAEHGLGFKGKFLRESGI